MTRQDKQLGKSPARTGAGDDRQARLGEALRANLRRRKAQSRRGGRGNAAPPSSPDKTGG